MRPACATLLFTVGIAAAQPTAFHCSVSSTTPLVRSSGITELVGELVLSCTGGRPTRFGQPVPLVNLQLFFNTAVTSRLTGDTGSSEAILVVDEPSIAGIFLCAAGQSISGTTDGVLTYDGSSPNHCNVFRAQQAGDNSIAWWGLPVDPPGNGTRVLRVKNIRINASLLGSAGFPPVQVAISTSPASSLPLDSSSAILALVRRSLLYEISNNIDIDLRTCGAQTGDASNYSVTVTEGFATAFRRRTVALAPDQDTSPAPLPTSADTAATESGFYNPALLGDRTGLADAGTRVALRLAGATQGSVMTLPLVVPLHSGSSITGFLRLAQEDSSGAGPFQPVPRSGATLDGVPAATFTVTGDSSQPVYEVLLSDPTTIETATIPMRIDCDSAANPHIGDISLSVKLEALSGAEHADAVSPVPRFRDTDDSIPAYTFSSSTCNLLFPFVSSLPGFDTAIAISNTSADPFGTRAQAGTVVLNYYGSGLNGGAAPRRQVSATVPAGDALSFTLSGGGNYGVGPVGNFQGYVIAQAAFQYCHGAAAIFGLNGPHPAGSYLGLVLNSSGRSSPEIRAH